MNKYYPYKSDKPNKKYYIITSDNKKFSLVLLVILILKYIKMKKENWDISKDIIMKTGLNPELMAQGFGLTGCYGIYQQ